MNFYIISYGSDILHSSDTGGKKKDNSRLFIDFKKAYDSVRRKGLYNILTGFGKQIKLVRIIKMCLN
jgi:hypothetical protein